MAMEADDHDYHALRDSGDGSLGYYQNGNGRFVAVYGNRILSSKAGKMTEATTAQITLGLQYQIGPLQAILGLTGGKAKERELKHLLFKYEETPSKDGPFYVPEPWPTVDCLVRPLHAAALRGRGSLIQSNQGRVYVLHTSIPKGTIRRGYLKVGNVKNVSLVRDEFHFLEWKPYRHRADKCLLRFPRVREGPQSRHDMLVYAKRASVTFHLVAAKRSHSHLYQGKLAVLMPV